MRRTVLPLLLAMFAGCQSTHREPLAGPTLDSAAGVLTCLQVRMEVSANNIANAQTPGFKAMRVITEDAPYRDRAVGPNLTPTARVGDGVRIARTIPDMSQGTALQTSGVFDLLIEGKGFFVVRDEGPEGSTVYTRAGLFSLNADGEIVRAGHTDSRLEPSITLPADAASITVRLDGRIVVVSTGASEGMEVGQLQLASFANPEGLKVIGAGLFAEAAESGQPFFGSPGTSGLGSIRQGMLEGSNVNLVWEQVEIARIHSLYRTIARYAPGSLSIAAIAER